MKKLVFILLLSGCATVTQSDRAAMYKGFAADHKFKCKAYRFDLSTGLTLQVPEMEAICQ